MEMRRPGSPTQPLPRRRGAQRLDEVEPVAGARIATPHAGRPAAQPRLLRRAAASAAVRHPAAQRRRAQARQHAGRQHGLDRRDDSILERGLLADGAGIAPRCSIPRAAAAPARSGGSASGIRVARGASTSRPASAASSGTATARPASAAIARVARRANSTGRMRADAERVGRRGQARDDLVRNGHAARRPRAVATAWRRRLHPSHRQRAAHEVHAECQPLGQDRRRRLLCLLALVERDDADARRVAQRETVALERHLAGVQHRGESGGRGGGQAFRHRRDDDAAVGLGEQAALGHRPARRPAWRRGRARRAGDRR